jgi:hypothetical protein
MVEWLMTDDLERIWKEAVVDWDTIPQFVCKDREKTLKSSVKIARVPSKIRSDRVPNTILKH